MIWEFALSGDRLLWTDAVGDAPYGRLRMRRLTSGVTSTLGQTRGLMYLSLQGSQLLVEVEPGDRSNVSRMMRYDFSKDAMPLQVASITSRAIERDDCPPVLAPGGGFVWSGVPSGIPGTTDNTSLFELTSGRGIVCLAREGYKPATVGRYVAYYVDGIGTTLRVDAVDPVTLERFRIAGAERAAWEDLSLSSWSLSYGTTLVVPAERTVDQRRVLRLRVFDLGS
jgi:hypothetical protein